MAVTASLRAGFSARQTAGVSGGALIFSADLDRSLAFVNGTEANQSDILWVDERTIGASGDEDIDLAGVLSGALGETIAMAELTGLLVLAASGNTNSVVIGAATDAVPLFGGSNGTFSVRPGGFFFIAAPGAAGQATIGAGTTDHLKVANSSSGSSVTYTIAVLGRTA